MPLVTDPWDFLSAKTPPSSWNKPKTEGTCQCGAISVTIIGQDFTDGTPRGYLCHCLTCRRSSGTDYAHNYRLPESEVVVIPQYKLSEYRAVSASGNQFVRTFCSACGTTITCKQLTPEFANDVVVRMGLFPVIPAPAGEMCQGEKVAWLRDKIRDGWDRDKASLMDMETDHK